VPARQVVCRIVKKNWVTPTVLELGFEPSKRFQFLPGQFLSIAIPNSQERFRFTRRAYSLSSAPPVKGAEEKPYEISVKVTQGGIGSQYLAALKVGDSFQCTAPYGDFLFEPKPGHSVCFISTGTGIGPFKSIIESQLLEEHQPPRVISLFGARNEGEILYKELFESLGVETVIAVSQPSGEWRGFRGRVTDYLKSLPADWEWHSTEFYICGNGEMVMEVAQILRSGRGVPPSSIHQECYSTVKTARIGKEEDLDKKAA